jgi:hypothetical protein
MTIWDRFQSILPPYCPPGSSYDSYNDKGERICKKEGDTMRYRFEKDSDCNPKVDAMGHYKLQAEDDEDDCDRKYANMPDAVMGKRRKSKSKRGMYKTAKGLSNCPDKQKYYPNSKRTCKKRKMVWNAKSKRCSLKKR